jgi:DNA-binding transcriptional ArsR family regulator
MQQRHERLAKQVSLNLPDPMRIPQSARLFKALGDSTRRIIYERLARQPMTVGDLARGLSVSRPAVSQHLKVLLDLRLVRVEPEGKTRLYRTDPAGLAPLGEWLAKHRGG